MKKLSIALAAMLMTASVCFLSSNKGKSSTEMSLLFENIEALAQSEGGYDCNTYCYRLSGYYCYLSNPSGSVQTWCFDYYPR